MSVKPGRGGFKRVQKRRSGMVRWSAGGDLTAAPIVLGRRCASTTHGIARRVATQYFTEVYLPRFFFSSL